MLETPEERIRQAGDRASQVIHAAVKEYGDITVKQAAQIIGISRDRFYKIANKHGVEFTKGLRPRRRESA